MQDVEELMRLPSPAPEPQSLAVDGDLIWMGSRKTCRIYAIESAHWTLREETEAPGTPWGMTVVGDELRVLCGETDRDNRIVRRFVPGHGFKTGWAIPAPDDTGSQLSFDGDTLYVSQWYNKKIIAVHDDGTTGTTIELPRGICGQVAVEGTFYCVTTADEESDDYFLTHVDARGKSPVIRDLARVPFPARALAFDGTRFWTNHRAAHEIVAFARPA